MATLNQIAEAAEVSPATVSLALRNKGRISDDTRKRVLTHARRLKYRRHRGNVSEAEASPIAAADRAYHIALFSGRGNESGGTLELFQRWLFAARRRLLDRGHLPMVYIGAGHHERDAMFDHMIHADRLDAALLMGLYERDGYLRKLEELDIPLMVFNRRPEHDEFSYVAVDNMGGGRLAAERLTALGHRKLALVRGDEVSFDADRAFGFETAARAAGAEVVERLQFHEARGDAEFAEVADALERSEATAAFFANDHLAQRIAGMLMERGVSIPRDLSIIGFDNAPEKTLPDGRRISSIAFDNDRLGRMAADLLLDVLDKPGESDVIRRSATLAVRYAEHETTAPPSAEPAPDRATTDEERTARPELQGERV